MLPADAIEQARLFWFTGGVYLEISVTRYRYTYIYMCLIEFINFTDINL